MKCAHYHEVGDDSEIPVKTCVALLNQGAGDARRGGVHSQVESSHRWSPLSGGVLSSD